MADTMYSFTRSSLRWWANPANKDSTMLVSESSSALRHSKKARRAESAIRRGQFRRHHSRTAHRNRVYSATICVSSPPTAHALGAEREGNTSLGGYDIYINS